MFWNKKKQKKKSIPQQKSSVPPKEGRKERPPQWQPTYTKPTFPVEKSIQKVEMRSEPKKNWEKEFLETFRKLTYSHRTWDVWQDLIIMCACAFSNPFDKENYEQRENRYMEIIKKYSKEERDIFPELVAFITMALEENPEQDFLGKLYMGLNLGDGSRSQFFTPYHVCQLMADIAVGDVSKEIEEKGFVSISDSCCGAGATLIAGIHSVRKQLEKHNPPLNYQNHILVVAQDIDETVALMCYIQLSLLGVAGYIKVGNSLTEPVAENDTYENYWFTPIYYSDVWQYRQIFRRLREREDDNR